jgi:hypothetical protein
MSHLTVSAHDANVLAGMSKQHSQQDDPLRHCPHNRELAARTMSSEQKTALALPHLTAALPVKDRVARALLTISRQEVCWFCLKKPRNDITRPQRRTTFAPDFLEDTSSLDSLCIGQAVHHSLKASSCRPVITLAHSVFVPMKTTTPKPGLQPYSACWMSLMACSVSWLPFSLAIYKFASCANCIDTNR